MFEKVSMSHPDKLSDRIAGAIVDLAYTKQENPKIAGEILLGHGKCAITIESSAGFTKKEIREIVHRIAGKVKVDLLVVPQDKHLADNQKNEIRCGDNGIFKGVPLTKEEKELSCLARTIYKKFPYDGKYILTKDTLIICQSNAKSSQLFAMCKDVRKNIVINPIGEWTGGSNVDSGCCNRKLGSDMAQSVTGGGLHFKDISKADVSVNIYCFMEAQRTGKVIEAYCAIGDTNVTIYTYDKTRRRKKIVPYKKIVDFAKTYIDSIGGFEKFAEWGLY